MIEPRRNRAAAFGLEIDVKQLGSHLAGRGRQRGDERTALPGDDVAEFQTAGAHLRQILLQPFGKRRVEIGDAAGSIDRKESGRRVIEIVDGVLQFLEDVFLPLELAGDVVDRPHRELGLALALTERPHAHAQPAPGFAADRIDAHLLLQAAAFARRLEQPEHCLRDAGIADEHPLDRPHVVGAGGLDQPHIGGIGVHDAPGGIGDQDRVGPAVDQALDQRTGRIAAGDRQHAGREREQDEHAEHRQDGQQEKDIGLGAGVADHHQRHAGADQHHGDQDDKADAAAALPGAGAVNRRPPDIATCLLLRHDRCGLSDSARLFLRL